MITPTTTYRVVCDLCHRPHWDLAWTTATALRSAQLNGWRIDAASSRHICPTCVKTPPDPGMCGVCGKLKVECTHPSHKEYVPFGERKREG
jgi:hypothetical protein